LPNQHDQGQAEKDAPCNVISDDEEPRGANHATGGDGRTDPLTAFHQLCRGRNLKVVTVMTPERFSLGHCNDSLDRTRESLLVPCQHFRWRDGELELLSLGVTQRSAEASTRDIAASSRSPTFFHALACVRCGVFATSKNSLVGWMLIEAIPIWVGDTFR